MEQGFVHLYWGDGKGKTTSALGAGLRMCGSGGQVLLAQFLKDSHTNERVAAAHVPGFFSIPGPEEMMFSFQMGAKDRKEAKHLCNALLSTVRDLCAYEDYQLVILDEVCDAVEEGFLTEQQVLDFLNKRPSGLEVIMTGHNPTPAMRQAADYVTHFQMEAHPYQKGVPARRGVEY